MAGEISTPHDNLFRSVFGDTTEASALLRAYLPQAISRQLLWSTLAWQPVGFIDDCLRDSESDLLYLIQRKADAAPAWLYVLLEHQSTPDAWLRLRLLKYSIRIWERDRSRYPNEKQLRPIVPLVWYQGSRRWRHGREFSELFAQQVREWPGVPRYAHLLIDQTKARPDQVRGELRGRIAQLAMMAPYRASWPLLQQLVPLLAELVRVHGTEDWREIVVYIAATTREPQRWHRFADAVRRRVPGGGELMNKTEQMLQIYGDVREQEGRQEGELQGKVLTIEAFLGRNVPWVTIFDYAAAGASLDELLAHIPETELTDVTRTIVREGRVVARISTRHGGNFRRRLLTRISPGRMMPVLRFRPSAERCDPGERKHPYGRSELRRTNPVGAT